MFLRSTPEALLFPFFIETRAKSEKLRSEVEHSLATAANTMLSAWNNTNQSFTSRIGESSEAHSKIQSQLSLTMQEMYDLGRHIANIKLGRYFKTILSRLI